MALEHFTTEADRLGEELQIAAIALDALGLAVTGQVPLDPNVPDGAQLVFKHVDVRFHVKHPDKSEQTLLSCSLAIRVQAAERLDALLEALRAASNERLARIKSAVETVQGFNRRLTKMVG